MKSTAPSLPQLRRKQLKVLIAGTALAMLGCAVNSEFIVTSKLEISEGGEYTLDGLTVSKEELKHALRARRPENGKLHLQVEASSKASYEAVHLAMQAAQYAEAQIGIVGNVRY